MMRVTLALLFLCMACQSAPVPRRDNCRKPCYKHYGPLCGSDGKTYGNKCMFNNGLCRNPSLKVKYNGECKDKPTGLILPPCIKARNSVRPMMLGAFSPTCTPDGHYDRIQCHGSTGYCWCVNPKTGIKIDGTEKRGPVKCDKLCIKARNSVRPMMLGAFPPTCTPDGHYDRMQCHGSTGYCWCVNPKTGIEISGTKKRGPVKCVPFLGDEETELDENEEKEEVAENEYKDNEDEEEEEKVEDEEEMADEKNVEEEQVGNEKNVKDEDKVEDEEELENEETIDDEERVKDEQKKDVEEGTEIEENAKEDRKNHERLHSV